MELLVIVHHPVLELVIEYLKMRKMKQFPINCLLILRKFDIFFQIEVDICPILKKIVKFFWIFQMIQMQN